uniref:Uncharacterized protein n=1 Tax=Arundo donax TaxID=35708 RepID=A0A0A9B720_ARUDO
MGMKDLGRRRGVGGAAGEVGGCRRGFVVKGVKAAELVLEGVLALHPHHVTLERGCPCDEEGGHPEALLLHQLGQLHRHRFPPLPAASHSLLTGSLLFPC